MRLTLRDDLILVSVTVVYQLRSGAVINLGTLQLDFPRECKGKV